MAFYPTKLAIPNKLRQFWGMISFFQNLSKEFKLVEVCLVELFEFERR